MSDDDKTPMERFKELGRDASLERNGDLKKPIAAEQDADEVMEGGIPPNGEAADE